MFLPASDPILPWTALLLGLWIPNFYYWGLNQYITQRTLGSASLAEGQKGIVFSAFMKLLIPFVIVIPGIIAFNLYSKDMRLEAAPDEAKVLAKYLKANPQTQFVQKAEAPPAETIKNWEAGRYLIAIYPDAKTVRAAKVQNPFVLPITRTEFEAATPAPLTVFVSEDHAWSHVNPGLAREIAAFNDTVKQKAGENPVSTEKIIAYKYDTALGQLLGNVLPQGVGLVGFVLAALLGAVVSSLAAMLNAASTIFSMDVFKKYISPNASQKTLVQVGRLSVVAFSVVAVVLAPQLGNPKISNSIFTIIQESQGFISPGILAVFAFGLLVRKGPAICGVAGLLTNIVAYGALKFVAPQIQFLNRMAICFGLCLAVMALITAARPLAQPVEFKAQTTIALEGSKGAKLAGLAVIAVTLLFYVIFSPLGVAR
jgi:SSS family solute:Na+ symporter